MKPVSEEKSKKNPSPASDSPDSGNHLPQRGRGTGNTPIPLPSRSELPGPEAFPERISKESINALPIVRYEGEIVVVRDDDGAKQAAEALRKEKVLGFDTESRPVFRRGVTYPTALVQLGTTERVYLFQLKLLTTLAPICEVLESQNILKVGVALRDDINKLRELEPFKERSVLDLATLTQRLGIVNTGLRSLSAIILNRRISKAAQVSNWAKDELSETQLRYAATDAWVSLKIYLRLKELGLAEIPREKRSKKAG